MSFINLISKTQDQAEDAGRKGTGAKGAELAPTEDLDQGRRRARPNPGAAVAMGITVIALVTMLTYFLIPPEQKPMQWAEADSSAEGPEQADQTAVAEGDQNAAGAASSTAPAGSGSQVFKLGGIMQFDGVAHALINDRLTRVGDVVDGARVVSIELRRVTLEKNGQLLVLEM
jgi:hypothetical protein